MDFNECLAELRNSPSADRISDITTEILQHDLDLKTRLHVVTTYLQHIIPVYSSLKVNIKFKVRHLFLNTVGISQVLSHYNQAKHDIYFTFMKDLLIEPTALSSVIKSTNGNRLELTQVKSLFFGSKIFQVFEGKFTLDKYLHILCAQLVEASKAGLALPEYFLSFLTIHPIEAKFPLFDTFFTLSNFGYLKTAYREMSSLQKRKLITSYLLPYLARFTTAQNVSTVSNILSSLDITQIEDVVLLKSTELNHRELLYSVAFLISNKVKQVTKLLELWGADAYVKDTPVIHQEQLTILILILVKHLEKPQKKDLSTDKAFLSAITTRLSSNDTTLRNYGMMVAKAVTDGEIEFTIEDEIQISLPRIDPSSPIAFEQLKLPSGISDLTIESRKETAQDSDNERDSDDENYDYDSDEDQSPPVFIKDLLTRLNDDKTPSITKLLSQTIRLVRQKSTFKTEIEFYSEELVSVLVGLINNYNEEKFDELKLNSIVSVIVVNPNIIKHVMTLLFTGDYSLQQRMIILSSISLSARELRGLDDSMIDKPEFDFPTNQIPQRQSKPSITEVPSEPKIMEITGDVADQGIGRGTITRVSRKLTNSKPTSKPNNFAKVAPKFFYPLFHAWSEGINMGAYNEMFIKHYLQTMELIVQAAYPCHGFEDMAAIMMSIKENSAMINV